MSAATLPGACTTWWWSGRTHLAAVIPCYPTQVEAIQRVAAQAGTVQARAGARQRSTHRVGGKPMATPVGKVLSVNVGSVREFEYGGRPARSAIWKSPAVGRIAARGINLVGDDQADRKAHGGPDKAL